MRRLTLRFFGANHLRAVEALYEMKCSILEAERVEGQWYLLIYEDRNLSVPSQARCVASLRSCQIIIGKNERMFGRSGNVIAPLYFYL